MGTPSSSPQARSVAPYASRATHGRHITPKQRQHGVTTLRTHVTHGSKEVITCACEAPGAGTLACHRSCGQHGCATSCSPSLLLPFTGRGWHVHVHLAQHHAREGPTTCFKDDEPHACLTHCVCVARSRGRHAHRANEALALTRGGNSVATEIQLWPRDHRTPRKSPSPTKSLWRDL